jgi:hypothetical protein
VSDWIGEAVKRPGAFRRKAKAAGMTTAQYARHVLREGSKADERTKKQARLCLALRKMRKKQQRNRSPVDSRAFIGGCDRVNTLIVNRDTFQMPADGWYQLAPLGEFPHASAGVVQVVDLEACEAMAARFKADSAVENFAGLLVDFDHFSLDDRARSEAAGWIVELDCRMPIADCRLGSGGELAAKERKEAQNRSAGLWAKIRWSDVGEEAVKGGRYRFLSPVWARKDCVDLGNGRVRPVRLLNAAVTNDPNLKGMLPLSNRAEGVSRKDAEDAKGEKRFKWVLGESPEGRHCPSCAALAGQVHTMEAWDVAGVRPVAGGLYCQGECHCRLVETGAPETGDLGTVPVRQSVENRRTGADSASSSGRVGGGPVDSRAFYRGAHNGVGKEGLTMKKVIEKLTNHLGLPGDASEDVILEKMQALAGLTAVADLQNSLKQAQDERDALQEELKGAEDDLVNRHLAEFEGVISNESREFWTEQLLENREGALIALRDIARGKVAGDRSQESGDRGQGAAGARKPLHNRATARPVIPGQGGGSTGSDTRAVKIRNRAHEICKAEKVPFSAAFRRAEKEVLEG